MCRVIATSRPTADSDIRIEVWLPMSGWNGRLQGIGTGGFAGVIPYTSLALSVIRGYAAAGTDTGHTNHDNAEWAFGHPEKVVDYGYRGIHEMTEFARATVQAFYGSKAEHAYFVGCSNGGRQALMEAQRFPNDYDGILAGAPANDWTHLLTGALWAMQATGDPDSYIPAEKWKAVEAAVNLACDARDGVKDGVLNDPRECRFDPATIECKGGDIGNNCLTAKQVETLKKIYDGPRDSHGKRIFFGLLPGAESGGNGWESWVSGKKLGDSFGFFFGKEFFSNMVYHDHAWDYRKTTLDEAKKAADERTAKALNATDPDLSRLAHRGGKLILYHGWNDPAIPATSTVDYFAKLQKKMGAAAETMVRLYMVPGMQHCGAGPGATSFGDGNSAPFDPEHNMYKSLEQWVEKGVAPGTIIASRTKPAMTRPLCPYPQKAVYKGTGNPDDATSFSCKE
jgi:feruloyl esterase